MKDYDKNSMLEVRMKMDRNSLLYCIQRNKNTNNWLLLNRHYSPLGTGSNLAYKYHDLFAIPLDVTEEDFEMFEREGFYVQRDKGFIHLFTDTNCPWHQSSKKSKVDYNRRYKLISDFIIEKLNEEKK